MGAAVQSLSFSKDGKILVSREADQTTREWDIATGKQLRVEKGK